MLLTVFLALCLADVPDPTSTYNFTQLVDHFTTSSGTFQQKVLVYDKHLDRNNGAIFVYAGNEGPIEDFYYNTGFMFDQAPEFGATIIFPEHRYYGVSWPFGEDSFTNENLHYLTIEQAVADFVLVIEGYKVQNNLDLPVVAFGGSYGGMLAAALRIHYPNVVDIALAASAPIPQALNGGVPGTTFFNSVTEDYKQIDPSCPTGIKKAFNELDQARQVGDYEKLGDLFLTCDPIATDKDANHLILWARNAFVLLAMLDYPYPTDFLGPLPGWPVKTSCHAFLEHSQASLLVGLREAVAPAYNATGDKQCFDIYAEYIECADQTGCGTGTDAKAWDYQACTDITLLVYTNGVDDMFLPRQWDMGNLTQYCMETYEIEPRDAWMRMWWPLESANTSSRIIYSNGLLDPWHKGGYLTDLSPTLKAVIVADGAHHLDLRESNQLDPQSVIDARNQEVEIIRGWLKEVRIERQQFRKSGIP